MTDTAGSDSRVIAIDGPSGTGKSSVAREVARRLDAGYLDTGAMYRAVTIAVLDGGIDPTDAEAVTNAVADLQIDVNTDPEVEHVVANGRDVTGEIRSPRVTDAVSAVSAVPGVRRLLVEQQRRLAEKTTVVEGRDIGTVVFPAAAVKIFLTADRAARAARRAEQLGIVEADQISALAQGLRVRDELDSSRALSPLRPASDAVLIDSTDMSREHVVEAILSAVLARGRSE